MVHKSTDVIAIVILVPQFLRRHTHISFSSTAEITKRSLAGLPILTPTPSSKWQKLDATLQGFVITEDQLQVPPSLPFRKTRHTLRMSTCDCLHIATVSTCRRPSPIHLESQASSHDLLRIETFHSAFSLCAHMVIASIVFVSWCLISRELWSHPTWQFMHMVGPATFTCHLITIYKIQCIQYLVGG